MPPIIEKEKCVKCQRCVEICALDVFGAQEHASITPVVRYPEECWHCRACVVECPSGAVSLRYPLPYQLVAKSPVSSKKDR